MDKKPDIVVWDEERGWYASKLPYGSDLGAPKINIEDIEGWRISGVYKANTYFESRFEELRRDYFKLVEEVKWTEMVYSADYNFEPIVGSSYYLYHKKNGTFLSLIGPEEFNLMEEYIGEFKLDHQNRWVKVS